MNDKQIAITTDLILERFWYLSVEEIKSCLRKAMMNAQVYDRLDGNMIIGWIADYDAERDEEMVRLNVEEKNRYENGTPEPAQQEEGALYFEEYVALVRQRAAEGDENSIKQLEVLDQMDKRNHEIDIKAKSLSDIEFKRWYYLEYLPSKNITK